MSCYEIIPVELWTPVLTPPSVNASHWEYVSANLWSSSPNSVLYHNFMPRHSSRTFQEPSTTTKVTGTASAYKVPVELYMSLRLLKWRRKWLNRSEISVPWPLILTLTEPWKRPLSRQWWPGSLDGIYMTVMINYLYNHCHVDPVIKTVCNHLHGAIRESHQTSAQAASVAIAAQCRMILDASTFWDLLAP